MIKSRITLSVTVLGLFAGMLQHEQAFAQTPAAGSIAIRSGSRELIVSPAELAKLPRHEQRLDSGGGNEPATVSGVFLWDLMQLLGVPSPKASGRQRAVMYIRLTGADGQNAVLALVDADPSFSKRMVLVADRRNGQPLDASEGPWRVFIPDDLRHARWIRGLAAIEIVAIK